MFGKSGQTDRERNLARGAYLFRVTEDILVAMEDQGVTRAQLAKRLGLSKARISQLLGGSSNMTIGTLSDIAFALGLTLDKTFHEYSERRYRIAEPFAEEGQYGESDFARSSIRNVRTRALESLASNERWVNVPDNVFPLRRSA